MTILDKGRKIGTQERYASEMVRPLNNRQMATKQWHFNTEPELMSFSPLILYPWYNIE